VIRFCHVSTPAHSSAFSASATMLRAHSALAAIAAYDGKQQPDGCCVMRSGHPPTLLATDAVPPFVQCRTASAGRLHPIGDLVHEFQAADRVGVSPDLAR
jgi:hypothetical protein